MRTYWISEGKTKHQPHLYSDKTWRCSIFLQTQRKTIIYNCQRKEMLMVQGDGISELSGTVVMD